MRLSDLLARPVRDSSGQAVGQVADVRLVQDGPLLRQVHHAFRVAGLIVVTRHTGRLFGYERGPAIKGPWLVRMLLKVLHRNTRYVPWEHVDRIDEAGILLRVPLREVPSVHDLYQESNP
ncbi:PRC-barrel domain containing protein [Nonomuraea jabiensis]|uniref:Sporulation protein YlmC with PRC-barrel domain n=1 Tax=Nonomuraea jabiensis TaxID=882448 RepID=A0A7W9GF87_9ACTN|nr:PRC-barrel domain containing protein [Nonomuraea jabiensis]MBB5782718.1 sporulation protein YlmC with PRC-barrel domain [Nonomuraea jabiensis]